jgi:hypothetical protein
MADGGGLARMGNGLLLAESIINAQKGGKFLIDSGHGKSGTPISNSLLQPLVAVETLVSACGLTNLTVAS